MSRRDTLGLLGVGAGAGVTLAGCVGGGGGGDDGVDGVVVGPAGELVFEPGTAEPLEGTAGTTVSFVWGTGGHNIHVDSQPDDAD